MAKFSHSTLGITLNHHQNTQVTNSTYQMTQNSGNANHTMTFKMTNISCNHQGKTAHLTAIFLTSFLITI